MIFITAKFDVLPEHAEDWPRISASFTEATRAEPGCLWFDWSRSLDRPTQRELPQYLASTPRIVNAVLDQDDWSELGELRVER
jgi:hypothetical protein